MTFTDRLLRLVALPFEGVATGSAARHQGAATGSASRLHGVSPSTATGVPSIGPGAAVAERVDDELAVLAREQAEALSAAETAGMAELRAAAMLVAEGHASRVTLAGFRSRPGLATEIVELSREWDVQIVSTIARGGGQIDIVVTREAGYGG